MYIFLILEKYFGEGISDEIMKFLQPTVKLYAYNACYGGFGLSEKGYQLYCKKKGIEFKKHKFGSYDVWKRDDPALIETVQQLGKEANGTHANIQLAEVFEEYDVGRHEYDGVEDVGPSYRGCFVDFVNNVLFEKLADSEKIMLMRQKKREIEWAQQVYRTLT
jgi:hypothetical protein